MILISKAADGVALGSKERGDSGCIREVGRGPFVGGDTGLKSSKYEQAGH